MSFQLFFDTAFDLTKSIALVVLPFLAKLGCTAAQQVAVLEVIIALVYIKTGIQFITIKLMIA